MLERSYGSFHRSIPLPSGVDADKAAAQFQNGVLTVTLPKTEDALSRVRKIEVKAT
ncbi:Hsp20/alpha crystallin family protein [Ensifer sp. YR511]|nr:Hsp20/alpha crystallin family protein [Ensifer sp. YR511]